MPAKRTCGICHQPVTMKEPTTLWFHTNLKAGTTHVWHMTCKTEQLKQEAKR